MIKKQASKYEKMTQKNDQHIKWLVDDYEMKLRSLENQVKEETKIGEA